MKEVRFYGDVLFLVMFVIKLFKVKGLDFFLVRCLRKLRELLLEVFINDLYIRLFLEFMLKDFVKRLFLRVGLDEDGELMVFD